MAERATNWERQVLDKFPPCDPSWSVEMVVSWLDMFDRILSIKRHRGQRPVFNVEPPY